MWGCKETGVEARLPQNSLRKCTCGALHPHLHYALKNQTEYFILLNLDHRATGQKQHAQLLAT